MNEVESAALMLAGTLLLCIVVAFAIWRARRLPKLPRKAPEIAEVEIAPSRLARVSGKAPLEPPRDLLGDDPFAPAIPAESAAEPAVAEAALETMVAEVEAAAAEAIADDGAEALTLHLVPQIPPRDAISTRSWLGGRPRLSPGMAWPLIDDQPADFLAQVGCADLPRDLWGGLGPRHGALAVFIHRRRLDVRVLHVGDGGAALAAPYALGDVDGWFDPYGGLGRGDLASFAVRAFPQWPVDLVAAGTADDGPGETGADGPADDLYAPGYDIADPAFHPFDWSSLTAMAAILEMRLDRLVTAAAADADVATLAAIDRCAAINREARSRAGEIIGIIRDSVVREPFSAGDATAVMAALHAIQWVRPVRVTDPESGGEVTNLLSLPLTTHRADADLWVHDYRTMLFDRAKHAWCADPANLPAPARALFEPLWRDLAAREMAVIGGKRSDDADELVLIDLPTSGLMSRRFGDGKNLVVTIGKGALATGDFAKARARLDG